MFRVRWQNAAALPARYIAKNIPDRYFRIPRGEALTTAIRAAERYVYLEDHYFYEAPGGNRKFELYTELCAAARRGTKVILVGSGRRDPADGDRSTIPPVVTRDLRRRVIDPLPDSARGNVIMYRIRDPSTTHSPASARPISSAAR